MSVSRTDISESGGIPAKRVFFAGRELGTASTITQARSLALAAGAQVSRSHQHHGPHVIVEGRDRFIIEAKVSE